MKRLFLAYHLEHDPETRTWSATGKDRHGRLFGVGTGGTQEAATRALKEAVWDSLAADAVDGVDWNGTLRQRTPKGEHLAFEGSDLLPIRLRLIRAQQSLKQADLAKRLRVSQQAYAKLERPGANPTLQTIADLEAALGQELMAWA